MYNILVRVLALGLCIVPFTWSAPAAAWPDKPIRLLVPAVAGTLNDVVARVLAAQLSTKWGKQVVVENFGGAGGIRGLTEFVRSAPDDHTLGFMPASVVTVTPFVFKDVNFDLSKEIMPIAPVGFVPFMIASNPKLEVTSIPSLIAYAQKNPGKLNMAVLPAGSAIHLASEYLRSTAKIDLLTVPFKGATDAVASVLSGDTDLTLGGVVTLSEFVKSGKLKAIAVTSRDRLPGFPEIPTVRETLENYVVIGWLGLFARTGTSATVVRKINDDVNEVLKSAEVAKTFRTAGVEPMIGSSNDLGVLWTSELPVWKKIVVDTGLAGQQSQ